MPAMVERYRYLGTAVPLDHREHCQGHVTCHVLRVAVILSVLHCGFKWDRVKRDPTANTVKVSKIFEKRTKRCRDGSWRASTPRGDSRNKASCAAF